MDICLVAAEIAPWSKTGGLGDVAGALPRALAKRGHRVMAVSPRYKRDPGQWDTGLRGRFHLAGLEHEVSYFHQERDGVHWVFLDNPAYLRGGIYGDSSGAYADNLFRYALLCRAALDAASRVKVGDGNLSDETVFHANDWHTGLLHMYLQATMHPAGRFHRSGVVLGLHNMGHHGSAPADWFGGLDLAPRWGGTLDMHGRLNPLKAGIVMADWLVAVSPTYARQITGEHGMGLEGVLSGRRDRLVGILNGVDEAWDPSNDRHLAAPFSADDLSGKAANKAALQRELGLPQRPDVPLLGVVARLDHQKGIDLVEAIAPWLLRQDVQLVLLGSGDPALQQFFATAHQRWPGKARGRVGFDEGLAHRIEAGCDIFLMPSRFEPCGLNQMYSMRYGTVPVVHATGGLADTVETVDPGANRGTGWAFRRFDADAFAEAISFALLTYARFPAAWREIQLRGMRTDFSWDRSAERYERVYGAARALKA